MNNLNLPIGSDKHLTRIETEGRFEQRQGQVATLQNTPELLLIEPLAFLLPRLYLVLERDLRVFINGVDLMGGGAEATDGDLLKFDDTQNIIGLALFNLPLKPLAGLFDLPVQAIGELLEEEGGLGETML